jgi:stage V sporulation protein R
VWLETQLNDRKVRLGYGADGFVQKTLGRFH